MNARTYNNLGKSHKFTSKFFSYDRKRATEKAVKGNDSVSSIYMANSSAATLRTTAPEPIQNELKHESGNEFTWLIYSSEIFVSGEGTSSQISL